MPAGFFDSSILANHDHSAIPGDGGQLSNLSILGTLDTTGLITAGGGVTSPVDKVPGMFYAYRRPALEWANITTVNVQVGNETATNSATIIFPDGTQRTDGTATHINFVITRNAALSGSAQSGLRATLSEANNQWYALYAVKVTDNATDFVTVGDTLMPQNGNFASLNSNFGTNGWVYLGLIANGDGSAAPGDILKFTMTGNRTIFRNLLTQSASASCMGIRLANNASTATINWSYVAGTSIASLQVPGHILSGMIQAQLGTSTIDRFLITDVNGNNIYYLRTSATSYVNVALVEVCLSDGASIRNLFNNPVGLSLAGFNDSVLSLGYNPLMMAS